MAWPDRFIAVIETACQRVGRTLCRRWRNAVGRDARTNVSRRNRSSREHLKGLHGGAGSLCVRGGSISGQYRNILRYRDGNHGTDGPHSGAYADPARVALCKTGRFRDGGEAGVQEHLFHINRCGNYNVRSHKHPVRCALGIYLDPFRWIKSTVGGSYSSCDDTLAYQAKEEELAYGHTNDLHDGDDDSRPWIHGLRNTRYRSDNKRCNCHNCPEAVRC